MNIKTLYEKSTNQENLTLEDGLELISCPDDKLPELLEYATKIREHFLGNQVQLCSIVNAKSGRCSEDCIFCPQSKKHKTEIKKYGLLKKADLLAAAETAKKSGAGCFSIVASGRKITKREFDKIKKVLKEFTGFIKSASLGILDLEELSKLKAAGLERYHHNLETAESFFSNICTTHSYQEKVNTIKAAKSAGLQVCCGGIFNLGESPEQRIELALALNQLEVDSIPLNILNPLPGTTIYKKYAPIRWQDILKIIAAFRFIMPEKTIGVMGGREYNLKEHQSKIFAAGANGILIGGYLTTFGNTVEEDKKMITSAGLIY